MKLNTYLGKKVDGAYERYMEKAKEAKEPEMTANPLLITANIKKQDYIKLPDTSIVIARQETEKGKNWADSHYILAENGLFMPTPYLFMLHFMNVKEAAKGKMVLHDASGAPIPRDEAEDLYKYFTSGHRGGCWTWLDAKFSEDNNAWEIAYNHKVAQKGKGKTLEGKTKTLESCIREDGYVNLDFNSQGLPIKKFKKQEYEQGENIRYWHPRNGAVARFGAGSGGAGLYCDWDPGDSDSSLGVFSCAEAVQKN